MDPRISPHYNAVTDQPFSPHSGCLVYNITPELSGTIRGWYKANGTAIWRGIKMRSTNEDGGIRFHTHHYMATCEDPLDLYLLGGNGDGTARARFNAETGENL